MLRNTANVDKVSLFLFLRMGNSNDVVFCLQSLLFDVEVLAVAGDETKKGLQRGPGKWAEGVKGSLT